MKSPSHRPARPVLAKSISLTHLAHRWEISRRRVRQLLQKGELPFEEVEGQLRVPLDDVEKYERRQQLEN